MVGNCTECGVHLEYVVDIFGRTGYRCLKCGFLHLKNRQGRRKAEVAKALKKKRELTPEEVTALKATSPEEEGFDEEISSDRFQFEKEGDKISGVLVDKGEQQMTNGTVGVYTLTTSEGDLTFFGSTILDRLMKRVSVGDKIQVIYEGKQKTNQGRSVKMFRVFRAK